MINTILELFAWYLLLFWDFEIVLGSKKKGETEISSYFYFMYQGLFLAALANGNVLTIDWAKGTEEEIVNRLMRILKK